MANRLKICRKKAGYSQRDVAKIINLSQGAISAWEMGRNRLNIETVKKLASLYNVSVGYLLELAGYENVENDSLKGCRIKAGLSQKEVAETLQLTQGAVSAWELGRNRLDIETAQKLADLYHVTIDELLGFTGQNIPCHLKTFENTPCESMTDNFIPLVHSLKCSKDRTTDGFPLISYVLVSPEYKTKRGPDIKLIEVQDDDSMSPTICPGDQLICIPGEEWQDGNIVVIDIDNIEMIRRVFGSENGGIDLVSDNKQFQTILFSLEESKNSTIHFLGRVAKVIGPDLL